MIQIEQDAWTALMARVSALEARDHALGEQITGLREDLRRIESRIYAIIATGIFASSASGALLSHFGG